MVEGTLGIQFIGTQRSGSNLLRIMLNQLNDISAPHPPHILKTFIPLLTLYGDLSVESNFSLLIDDVCEWVNNNPVKWSSLDLNSSVIRSMCKQNNLIEIFWRIYQLKAHTDGARYWCCKSMENVYFLKEIESYNLKPFYIFLYRDGRDVALSFTKAIVGPKHLYPLAVKWKKEQQLAIDFLSTLNMDRFISIRYEDFIKNPETVVKEICTKLKIEYSSTVLNYYTSGEAKNTASSGAMWQNVTQPVIANNNNKFESVFTREEVILFETVAGDLLQRLNYKTIYWPNHFAELSSDQIQKFEKYDAQMKDAAIKSASHDELNRRLNQEKILEKIKLRVQPIA